MKEIILHKNTYRGICVSSKHLYITDNKVPKVHIFSHGGEYLLSKALPTITGALTLSNGIFFAASYSAPKPQVYKLSENFKVLDRFNYLCDIPPKFLPSSPYEKYAVGICKKADNLYLTLQNCPNIFVLKGNGELQSVIEKVNPDICGIDFHGDDLYSVDKSTGQIYKGDTPVICLDKAYHPFDICIYNGTLYVVSSMQNKVALFNL